MNFAFCRFSEVQFPLPGLAVALDGPTLHLEPLAAYSGVGLVHHARVALGPAVHEPFVLLDVLEGLALPPPVVDGRSLPLLLVVQSITTRVVATAIHAGLRPEEAVWSTESLGH